MLDRIVDFFLNFAKAFQFWVIVYAYEQGVHMRFGKFLRVLQPGLWFCWPFHMDHVLVDNVVTRTVHIGAQSLTTKDGKSVVVSAVITLKINDIYKALLEVESIEHAMMDVCYGSVSRHVDSSTWEQLHSEEAFDGLSKECRRAAKRYGLEVDRVQLADLSVCKTFRMVNSDHPTRYEEKKEQSRL